MFCKEAAHTGFFSIAFFALFLTGCTRGPAPVVERLAVLPLENLSSDPAWDWAGRAVAGAVVYDLAGSRHIYAQTAESLSGAQAMQARRMLEGYFLERGGRLEFHATLEDLSSNRAAERLELGGPASEGMLPLTNELARRLSAEARRFGTSNREAFRSWGESLAGSDRQAALRSLEAATQADPAFTAAYEAQARILAAAGQRKLAEQVLEAAARGPGDAIEQAELRYVSASASGDAGGRQKALETLAAATPSNADLFAELGQLRLAARDFAAAVRGYQEAARLNPEEDGIWNELGYALAYAQDLTGARRALEQYQRQIAPDDTNALDSLGEVSFYLGDFEGAGKYFLQAAGRNPAELLKAAQARLMVGDPAGGDALFRRYMEGRRGAQRARGAYEEAQWEFLTGSRRAARERLEKLVPELDADGQALALSQLSVWRLASGDAGGAADLARQAAARASSVQARNISAMCAFIASGGRSSGVAVADAYSDLFARRFQEAAPLLESLYRATDPARDGEIRMLLAWAYVETGRAKEAGKLLALCPIPLASGDPLFAGLIFPRYFFLRAAALESEGKRDEARKSYQLYLKYPGDTPDIFGDAARARQRLGATN